MTRGAVTDRFQAEPRPILAAARCRGCQERVLWAVSVTTGKPVALDEQPTEAGTFTLNRDSGRARHHGGRDLIAVRIRYGRADGVYRLHECPAKRDQ